MSELAPEDAMVVAEVFRQLRDLVGDMRLRADGAVNTKDLWFAIDDVYQAACRAASAGERPA